MVHVWFVNSSEFFESKLQVIRKTQHWNTLCFSLYIIQAQLRHPIWNKFMFCLTYGVSFRRLWCGALVRPVALRRERVRLLARRRWRRRSGRCAGVHPCCKWLISVDLLCIVGLYVQLVWPNMQCCNSGKCRKGNIYWKSDLQHLLGSTRRCSGGGKGIMSGSKVGVWFAHL
jgi:hypothetical protein